MLDPKELDSLRTTKEVQITKTRKVVVKEFTTAEVYEMFKADNLPELEKLSLEDFIAQVNSYLPKCLEGATLDELKQLPPSKLQEIWNAFKECNSVFFVLAQSLGLSELGARLKSALVKDFLAISVGRLRQAIPASSNTDTPTS